MKIINKILSTIVGITMLANSLLVSGSGIVLQNAYASGSYENIIAEVLQIDSYISSGLYLEAIELCNKTLSTRNISDSDKAILTADKEKAENAYNAYLTSLNTVSYANIANEVNRINSYISRGLYLEAISLCNSTLSNYTLSPDDINLLNNLKNSSESRYNAYLSSSRTSTGNSSSSSQNVSYTVYRTKTGSKYHRNGCRYLSRSKIAISKSDAISIGLTPCSVCKP